MESVDRRPFVQALAGDKRKQVCNILQDLIFTEEHMQKFMSTFEEQINYANNPNESEQKKSDLWWGYTYVSGVLQGNENGKYIGLDLGGTHFRIILVEFVNGIAETTTKYFNIHRQLLTGPCEKVFDQIAASIQTFLHDEEVRNDKPIPLGFTFSFPSEQTSLKHCTIKTWTKSFQCTTGVGLDPLSPAVNVVARIGDSTGTLMASIYADKQCTASLILGTGSNACIVEDRARYKRVSTEDAHSDKILVDVEWGALGDNGCLDFYKNEFEREINKFSNHPDSYTLEKSFSGMYIGELVRLCLVKLIDNKALFNGKSSKKLDTRWSLNAKSVASIESETDGSNNNTLNVLKEFDLHGDDKSVTEEDIALVKEVCYLVSQRGAYIVASALAVLLKRMEKKEISVGIDGSLYEHHPNYHKHMMEVLNKLLPDVKVKLFLLKDGSGEGAAFVAAVAMNDLEKHH
ncbi:HK [Mytilus edulis]|uniref:Phosphotransferase n=1 Tax=Mytilus edulis TaxID=6550 RepID=A0A8S3ST31_MYTED|nr:HK [Mytilus edulis]